jgi:hypothetical protein
VAKADAAAKVVETNVPDLHHARGLTYILTTQNRAMVEHMVSTA